MPPLRLRAWVWVCMATVRLAACGGSWKEERRSARAVLVCSSPAGWLFLETLFLLAGCIRLALAVLLVYGSPLELY